MHLSDMSFKLSVQSISVSFLVVIAFQRFFRICRPFKTGIPKITKCVYAMATVVQQALGSCLEATYPQFSGY
jgi:hypothetical protein